MHPTVFAERPRVAVACGCGLGESPLWDGRTGTLLWVDIQAGALWHWQPQASRPAASLPLGEPVGFVSLTPDPGRVLVGLKSGIASYGLEGRHAPITLLRPEPDRPGNRLNDATVAPDGSLLFGSMDDAETAPSGRFYRWAPDGLEPFGEPAVVTNGPAIDPDRHLLYGADTQAGRIYRHPLGPGGGVGPGEEFVQFGPGDGHPDGLTVDAEGHLWVCHWGAARVTRYRPDGVAVLVVPMPTAQVTKLAFGGPDLTTAYVTTAATGRDREIDLQAGHLLSFEAGVRGHPASLCRMDRAGAAGS